MRQFDFMRTTETTFLDRKKTGLVPARDYWGKRRRRRSRPALWVPADAGTYQDRIAQAVAREREHRRLVMPERGTVLDHVFQCVCCGRIRGDEERREPASEV